MQTSDRRRFLNRLMAGTAALALVGRAVADDRAPGDGKSPSGGNDGGCAQCAYFTRSPGSTSGTCGYRDGQPVPADGGCGNFKPSP